MVKEDVKEDELNAHNPVSGLVTNIREHQDRQKKGKSKHDKTKGAGDRAELLKLYQILWNTRERKARFQVYPHANIPRHLQTQEDREVAHLDLSKMAAPFIEVPT